MDIVCVGQAVVDCITRGKEEKAHKKNVYRAESISLSTGGDAFNESVILSRLGHQVKLVCGIGDDLAGSLILESARKNGVDTSGICIREDLDTPVANLMVNTDGTRTSVNSPATMLGEYIPDAAQVKGGKILSLASLFRAPLDRAESIIALVRAAKDEGAIVCADTKLPTFRTLSFLELKEILPLIDYIFPNENEAAFYSGETDFYEMAKYFRSLGVKNVIVKTGQEGCVVCGEEESFRMKALPVEAVDSTGAGDNFVAGFLSGILQGMDLRDCVKYGTCCAAACVQAVGTTAAVKSRKSVQQIIDQYEGRLAKCITEI